MLFDLRGKRRRLVQVVYATLAALFLIGFVGFSIGSGNSPRLGSSTRSGWAGMAAARAR